MRCFPLRYERPSCGYIADDDGIDYTGSEHGVITMDEGDRSSFRERQALMLARLYTLAFCSIYIRGVFSFGLITSDEALLTFLA